MYFQRKKFQNQIENMNFFSSDIKKMIIL